MPAEDAAAIEAELSADHAVDADTAPELDPAWDLPELAGDQTVLDLSQVASSVLPAALDANADVAAPACFIADPVLEPDATATNDPPACGLVPLMPLAVPTPIEHGQHLAAFHDALARAARGDGQARVVFYGASHVASDLYTGVVRDQLAAIADSAGPGFFLPAKPWKYYRHAKVTFDRARGFRARRITTKTPEPDAYGLAGVALDAFKDRPAHAAFTLDAPTSHAQSLEVFYLQRPQGGSLDVFIEGSKVGRIRTHGARGPGYARFAMPAGSKRVELRAPGDGALRLFGVAIESERPGVVLDTLGIPGARARYHLLWDDGIYRDHLAHRRPDLVVLAYGTNESGDDSPMAQYESELRSVLGRIRQVSPSASCLLVGPSDRPVRLRGERYGETVEAFAHRPRTALINDAQRRIARELGCGYFDVVEFMGGPLSMVRWVRSSPALGTPDHVHFTRNGYNRMGHALTGALLEGAATQAASLAHKQ